MLQIHPNARTTPVTRAEIAGSHERSGVLAQRYGVSTETIRKWRKRGPADCQDRSARPHKLPWKASDEERAIVCALRRATGFPLDDLTFILTHFLPHLNRDAVYRILKAEGLNRLPPAEKARKPHSAFEDDEVGFIHVDVKHLPKGCACPSCRIATASRASAPCTSPSTAPRAPCTSPSKTTRPPPRPSPSSTRRSALFPLRSRTC